MIPILFRDRKLEATFEWWVERQKDEQGGFFLCDTIPVSGRPGKWKIIRPALKSLGYKTAYIIQSILPMVNIHQQPQSHFYPGNWERFMEIGWSSIRFHDGWKPVQFHTHPNTTAEPSLNDWACAELMAKPPYYSHVWSVVGARPFEIRTFEVRPVFSKETTWDSLPFIPWLGSSNESKAFRKALKEAPHAPSHRLQ